MNWDMTSRTPVDGLLAEGLQAEGLQADGFHAGGLLGDDLVAGVEEMEFDRLRRGGRNQVVGESGGG